MAHNCWFVGFRQLQVPSITFAPSRGKESHAPRAPGTVNLSEVGLPFPYLTLSNAEQSCRTLLFTKSRAVGVAATAKVVREVAQREGADLDLVDGAKGRLHLLGGGVCDRTLHELVERPRVDLDQPIRRDRRARLGSRRSGPPRES